MADDDISKLKVVDLKRELRIRGLKVTGNKNELAERLQSATNMHIEDFDNQIDRGTKKRLLPNNKKVEQLSIIFKMPIEIIEYIFDYLTLTDLSAVSATCKRMQQLAGRVYQKSYSGHFAYIHGSQMNWNVGVYRAEYDQDINIKCIVPFVDKISAWHYEVNKFLIPQSKFHHIKQLRMRGTDFRTIEMDKMKGVLNKIAYLHLYCCKMDESFLENLLSFSPNLKRLYLSDSNAGQRWLERSYPTLEHFEIDSRDIVPISKLLTLNPNLRTFGSNTRNLWGNRFLIKTAGLKLEELTIKIGHLNRFEEIEPSFWQLLNECYQLGVYKRLSLYYAHDPFNQNFVDEIANLTVLNRLHLHHNTWFQHVALSRLIYLEDINFPDSRYITDIETMATLENLKFIYFGKSNMSHVKLFIGRTSKLERIQINWFMDEAGHIEDDKVINLVALNKERNKLANAKIVTLFVQERVYLATKRAKRETHLDFIKLKRMDTLDGRAFDFEYPEIYYRKFNEIN